MNTFLRTSLATLALVGVFMTQLGAPARADGASTTRTIIGIAAGVAAIATVVNLDNKHREANNVVGYLSDGSTVYGDGRVVSPNGQTWYPGNQGEQVACNGQSCYVQGNGQYNNGNGYNNGYNNNGYNPYNNNGYNNSGYYNNGYNNYPQQQQQRRHWPPQ